ncbi:MAG: hypothetical protein P1R58_11370 [bacterium]|nr:hypothetical protein [bacterium]
MNYKKTILLLLSSVILVANCFAVEFTIKEVFEVGPISGGMTEPIKWSPDGSQFAYFYEGHLYLADTMGHAVQSVAVELPPSRFEWLSDKEIVVSQWERIGRARRIFRLDRIDISDGSIEKLDEYTRQSASPTQERGYTGPFKTMEGNLYCRVLRNYTESTIHLLTSKYRDIPVKSENHFLRVGDDAIYLVRLDLSDSTKVSNEPYKGTIKTCLSPDTALVFVGSAIVRLSDDSVISLDAIPQPPIPEGTTGCGYGGSHTFNPVYKEVAFRRSCDDEHSYVVNSVGVYDYESRVLTLLSDELGLSQCDRPVYGPDGLMLAFLCEGSVYLLKRRVL